MGITNTKLSPSGERAGGENPDVTVEAKRVPEAVPRVGGSDAGASPVKATEAADKVTDKASTGNFRFNDNRQKYLMFVNTCTEKWAVGERVEQELQNIHPKPPAIRVFDAGVGDGTVLTRVMRSMHLRFPTLPFYIVAKEISLEDVRLTLEKTPDRFFEHPAMVLVITNLYYKEAPWLNPQSISSASTLSWNEVALSGTTSREFEKQITDLQPLLAENWRTTVNKATGNLGYERPAVLVLYREDHRFLLNSVIPRRGAERADYDLVIASQPYRLRAPVEFKASRVLAPLAKALGPGGRLVAIQSHGGDPGQEILQGVWPGENPFIHDRHQILKAVKEVLGSGAKSLNFNSAPENRALFRHDMHTMPAEIEGSIGTSTLFAAWNAAIYVGQIEDARLEQVLHSGAYIDVTRGVLKKHGGLWFWDEAFCISRRRDF